MAGSLQMSFWLKILFDAQASECLPPETWPIDGAGSVSFGGYLNQQPKPGGSKVSFHNSAFSILGGMRFQSIFFWTPSAAEEKYIRGGTWREELQDTPLLAETKDGGSGKKQEYSSESREPTPSHLEGPTHFCPWCW